jgi:queuine tRNA-ribosyltransferase
MAIEFSIEARCGAARAGRIRTPHGVFETPAFMPCGTKAAVKGLEPRELRAAGIEILLCNAYHLALRPGEERVAELGGLQKFMGWDGPLLTDSGGYQVFSLAGLRKIDDDGVTFQSHLDGARVRFTPERVVEIQEKLGADIIMPLDEPIPFPPDPAAGRRALDRTHAWWKRSRSAKTALFGIVQGSVVPEWRKASAETVAAQDPPGFALGGFSMGEPAAQMDDLVGLTCAALPDAKPRYLMGVGMPRDILEAVRRGVDMFDCILPTRMGRTAMAFTDEGLLRVRNARFAKDERPLDGACDQPCCRNHTRAYLRHLFMSDEMLGPKLLSLHNVAFYARLMRRIRESIRSGALGGMTHGQE